MASDIQFEVGLKDTASAATEKMVADIVAQQKKLVAAFKASGVEVQAFDDTLKDTAASGETQDLAKRIGIGDVAEGFAKARKHAEGLNRSVAAFVPAVGGLVAAAGAIGVGRLFTGWTDAAAQLDRTAQSMGIGVNRLDQTQNALRLTGASAEAATSGLQGLQTTMRGAIFGHDADSNSLFQQLGVDIGSLDKGARRALDVMPQVAEAVKKVYQPGNPDAALHLLERFGLGPEWLIALKDGAAGWQSYMDAAAKAGTVTQQQADAARELQQEQTRLNVALEHFGYEIAGDLGPELIPIVHSMADWVQENRDWLSTDITGALKELISRLNDGTFNKVGGEIKDTLGHVDAVVTAFGGWKVAIEGLGLAWAANSPPAKLLETLTKLAAFRIPVWLGRLLGVSSLAGGAVEIGAAGMLAAGAAAGAMNVPMVDDYGRVIGNWGGADGEAARLREYYRARPSADPYMNGDVLGQGATPRKVIPNLSTAEQKRRAQYVYDYYRQHGWSDAAALAPVANLQAESHFNDRADNGTHYGAGQWDVNRQNAFRAVFGHDIRQSTFEEQVQFSEWELHNGDPKSVLAGKMMQAAKTPEDAARAYSHFNERPGSDVDDSARALAAERLGSQINRSGVPADQSSAAASAAPVPTADDDSDHFGRLRIEVIHRDPPPGASVQVTPTDSGNMQVAPPRVEQSMPSGQTRNVARDGY